MAKYRVTVSFWAEIEEDSYIKAENRADRFFERLAWYQEDRALDVEIHGTEGSYTVEEITE